jgi:rhodanese-related sulfurtransferase
MKSGQAKKTQCGRISTRSSSSSLRNFLGNGTLLRVVAPLTKLMANPPPGRKRPGARPAETGWPGPVSLGAMSYSEVTPDEIRDRLSKGEEVFLVDVREPDEVEEWAYPIGVNIPLGQLGARVDELPRHATIVVACAVGGRSAQAATALSEAGYTAENLTGGAVAWAATEPE